MSSFRDLINVTFEDAVTYGTTDTSDILGVIMPYHWGPAGEVNIFNRQEFYEAYPEQKSPQVTLPEDSVYTPYYQIKSFFNNGGSRVAVYRPKIASELFAESQTAGTIASVKPIVEGGTKYLVFKYPGIPNVNSNVALGSTTENSGDSCVVVFTNGQSGDARVIYESFEGQLADPTGVDSDTGETTYLPTILEQKSQYMQIVDVPSGTSPSFSPIPASYTPGAGTDTIDSVFATDAELVPTMFLSLGASIKGYYTSVAFIGETDTTYASACDRFAIKVKGKEKIQVFNVFRTIDCSAGVAGAYSNIARQTHLNQIASARAYGTYVGTLTTGYTFQEAQENMSSGIVTVYSSAQGPQIFGTRNSFNVGHSGSYFARCNVSRVLASILKNVISSCIDVIHTDTAANAISRKRFETDLNNIIGSYISTQDLQADSTAICNGSNNTDAQTQGGTILNIILALHFIGLVEKVNIRVVATDSSVTVNFS